MIGGDGNIITELSGTGNLNISAPVGGGGGLCTDPLVENVLEGVTYTINGVFKTGTLILFTARITESGDTRITESGDTRILN